LLPPKSAKSREIPRKFELIAVQEGEATENARHENVAQRKMQEWKMRHKTAGMKNARLENTAQEILGWKMREKSV